MTTVTHTVTRLDGTPLPGVDVLIRIPGPVTAFDTISGANLSEPNWLKTDTNGNLSIDLPPQSEVTPAGTYYELSTPYVQGSIVLPFVIPDGAGPFRLLDILVENDLPVPGPIRVGITSEELDAAVAAAIGSGSTTTVPLSAVSQTTIAHTYPYPPDVRIIRSDGTPVWTDVTYPDPQHVHLFFPAPFTGTAVLS